MKADEKNKSTRKEDSVDAFGTKFAAVEEPMPEIKLSGGFTASLRTMFKEHKCQYRYGRIENATYPIAPATRLRLKSALEWISAEERRNITWSKLDTGEILFAYPENTPSLSFGLAALFQRTAGLAQSSFEQASKRFLNSLKEGKDPGIDSRANRIQLFILKKLDKGRTKIVYTYNTTPAELEWRSEIWWTACRNLPELPHTFKPPQNCDLFPLEIAGPLNSAWKQDCTLASNKFRPFSGYHGLELFFDDGSMARNDLSALLRNLEPTAVKLGRCAYHLDASLSSLLEIHRREVQISQPVDPAHCDGDLGVFLRLSLSCMADADHSDTAESAGRNLPQEYLPNLRAKERLAALDQYVRNLEQSRKGQPTPRDSLRSSMYWNCRNAVPDQSIVSCDSPVGSAKTTAVMAHLLTQAARRGLRRIFVVLPYTNIITQAVQDYRKALTLPGEKPEEVVAELHHRADFEDNDLRYLTALWRAPIIVTTAVGFYETLASNKPAALRRLHELPGSAIFVDEAHATLPVHLLSTAWHWMQVFAREWNCYWLLASGSLVRFWTFQTVIPESCTVPELVSQELRGQLLRYESSRVSFCWEPKPLSREELIHTIMSKPGPRLLIVNTVQSAAVLARDIAKTYGQERVEHLSTSLTPMDRANTIERVKTRLTDPSDTDWVLVATSCVEAGVDFSFHTGFREAASMVSLLQTAGRVNRNGSQKDAEVWTFQLQDAPLLKRNPGLERSAAVLLKYLKEGLTPAPELSTRSIEDELKQESSRRFDLYLKETELEFQTIAEKFVVIDSDTVPVVVDPKLAENFRLGYGDWQLLQKNSVSIPKYHLDRYRVVELKPGLYCWELPYSSFLGYMEGIVGEGAEQIDFITV